MAMSTEDRLAIHELVGLHGHLMDAGQLDQLTQLFTEDVAYDLTPMGGPILYGVNAIQQAAQDLGARNPVAHLVTNTVVDEGGEVVTARSKFLGVQRDGSVGSGTYNDQFRRTTDGWRICARRVSLRREPLTP
jgi:3-phenylpropionate/cinnamic acid dioxygenase small subunit